MILRTPTTFLLMLLFAAPLFAQVNLKPSIGIDQLPANQTPICNIPLYLESFLYSGYEAGDTIPDFQLFDLQNNPVVMSELLEEGKPVLLIAGSYTCQVFRGKVALINQLADAFGDELNILIVYTLEAHPQNDISPYFGFENVTSANLLEGVLYPQADTYGQRKAVLSDMLAAYDIQAPIVLDSPCNDWWQNFGPAPNNSYLISPEGIVLSKHPWFDKYPYDIYCDLYDQFGWGSPCDNAALGTFDFYFDGDSLTVGEPGQTLYVNGGLENLSSTSSVLINIRRIEEQVPLGWETAICTDICLGPEEDQTNVLLGPDEFLVFTFYFYTTGVPGEGNARIFFRNNTFPDNTIDQVMYGKTEEALNASEQAGPSDLALFPNPASSQVQFALPEKYFAAGDAPIVRIFDPAGVLILEQRANAATFSLDATGLAGGLYVVQVVREGILAGTGKLLIAR